MIRETTVVSELSNRWWPLPPEKFFTMQRADDMWFGDELPPTIQDEMRSPLVTQSKAMIAFQLLQGLAQGAQRDAAKAALSRRQNAKMRYGKRRK